MGRIFSATIFVSVFNHFYLCLFSVNVFLLMNSATDCRFMAPNCMKWKRNNIYFSLSHRIISREQQFQTLYCAWKSYYWFRHHNSCIKFIYYFTCFGSLWPLSGKMLSRDCVMIDGVWIGNWVYLTLTGPWLQVIITVSLIHTLYSSLEHTLKWWNSIMTHEQQSLWRCELWMLFHQFSLHFQWSFQFQYLYIPYYFEYKTHIYIFLSR
jgi:hypothetical protein